MSGISVAGVAIATAAMICVLSVFNGFRDLVAGIFTAIDPELRIELVHGKTVAADDPVLQAIRCSPSVAVYTEVLEENALLRWRDHQVVATIKGVSSNFDSLVNVHDVLVGEGDFCLKADVLNFGIAGMGVASRMGLPLNFSEPLQVWAPRHGERINMANPVSSFRHDELLSPGLFFFVGQSKYDDAFVLAHIDFARHLFDYDGRVSHVELRLAPGASRSDVENLIDSRFRVLDRYQQQSDTFRVMNIEKLVSYIFLTFILLVAAFNIVGSLSMLIIEKNADAQTLRALGASDRTVRNIFALEGRLIAMMGAAMGLVVGLLLCWLQMQFGLITLGASEGSFIVNTYPVSVQFGDVALVFVTVVIVSWFTVLWPVRGISTQKSVE